MSEIRLERDQEAKKVSEKIRVITNKALKVYHEIFDDESGECGLKDKGEFAKHFLNDMSGLRAPTKVQSVSAHFTLTDEELNGFKERGIKAAHEIGTVIEGEVSETEGSEAKRQCQASQCINNESQFTNECSDESISAMEP